MLPDRLFGCVCLLAIDQDCLWHGEVCQRLTKRDQGLVCRCWHVRCSQIAFLVVSVCWRSIKTVCGIGDKFCRAWSAVYGEDRWADVVKWKKADGPRRTKLPADRHFAAAC